MRKMSRTTWLIAVAVLVGGVGAWRLIVHFVDEGEIRTVTKGVLYRSGQLERFSKSAFARRNIKTIVNMRERCEDPAAFDKEAEFCRQNGIRLANFGVGAVIPGDVQIAEFLRIVKRNDGAILVHCAQGRNRTGVMAAAYRIILEGWSANKALDEMIEMGGEKEKKKLEEKQACLQRLEKDRAKWLERISHEDPAEATAATRPH